MKYINEDLVEVYLDTLEKGKEFIGSPSALKYYYSDINLEDSNIKPIVKVEPFDTVSMLEKYGNRGKVCVLNMASYKRSGGGVERGARAQEESLYRCSTLGLIKKDDNELPITDLYPLEDNSAIYVKNSIFFKDFYYNVMDPILTDVITIAAYNHNKPNLKFYDDLSLEDATYQKILFMFQLAGLNKVDTLLLGAFGCGVFNNDPQMMADAFKRVINDGKTFGVSNIIFPVINDHNSSGDNYRIFRDTLHNLNG